MAAAHSEEEIYEEEEILLFLLLLRRRRRRLRAANRQTWTKRWILRRQTQGTFANLIRKSCDRTSYRHGYSGPISAIWSSNIASATNSLCAAAMLF